MVALPLLQDGSCSLQNSCLTDPASVHARCPQAFKCGTCVAWSPREKNRFTRNAGQCLLDRSTTQYLDCNAPICPYYRPRSDNPAVVDWKKAPAGTARRATVRARSSKLTREAPSPSREALAHAAFRDHDDDVAAFGAAAVEGLLAGLEPLPPLLERFRGGIARVTAADGTTREVPLEALWVRIVMARRALALLDDAVAASALDAATREKAEKDLAGIAGSMTTFNLLFAKKEDGFKGSGKGE